MKINLTQISISDRINAAQIQPSATDTQPVPNSIDPSPGDSTIAPPDTTQLDSAGSMVNQQTQMGNRATSDSARKSNNPANQNLQYDKQSLSAGDQAPTPKKSTDIGTTPPPKTKSFKESLIDKQIASQMSNRTGGDRGSIDQDFGRDNGNPGENIKNQPGSEPIRRDKITPYTNSTRIEEPSSYPISDYDTKNDMAPYKAPDQNLGPTWKQGNVSAPNLKFNTPRVNTPRFK